MRTKLIIGLNNMKLMVSMTKQLWWSSGNKNIFGLRSQENGEEKLEMQTDNFFKELDCYKARERGSAVG